MDPDAAETAIDHAGSLDLPYAEARWERWDETEILLRNGTLDASERRVDEGLGVRVRTDQGLGFASTDRVTDDRIREAVEAAAKNARAADRRDPLEVADAPTSDAVYRVDEDEPLADLGFEERLEDLRHLDDAMTDAAQVPMRLLQSHDWIREKVVQTTEGTRIRSTTPCVHLFYHVTVKDGADTRQAHRSFGRTGGWEILDAEDVVATTTDELEGMARHLSEGRPTRPRETTLVVGPEVAGIAAHESCGHPLEADRILGREAAQAGTSFVDPSMRGDRIGSEQVTIVDDPTRDHAYGHYLYDDEGVPAGRRVLMDEGRIGEFLHDRETAGAMALDSNGSSRATRYDRENIVRMANTYVEPGDWSREEILEEAGNGIYMKSFTEWNIDDRRYHQKYVAREAYRIEDGELGDPIPDLHIETTTPGFWSKVEAVGEDLGFDAATCGKCDPIQGIPVYTGGPTMLLDAVKVGVSS